jgi:hypothetical protein
MTTKIPETLETMIERLVREHLAGQQLAARAAVERAFSLAAPRQRTAQRRQAKYRRRPPTEITQLAERVLEAVRACPGETMTVIAARVGERPRVLLRPMMHLKDAGRVRSAGERSRTRYFPMAVAKSA